MDSSTRSFTLPPSTSIVSFDPSTASSSSVGMDPLLKKKINSDLRLSREDRKAIKEVLRDRRDKIHKAYHELSSKDRFHALEHAGEGTPKKRWSASFGEVAEFSELHMIVRDKFHKNVSKTTANQDDLQHCVTICLGNLERITKPTLSDVFFRDIGEQYSETHILTALAALRSFKTQMTNALPGKDTTENQLMVVEKQGDISKSEATITVAQLFLGNGLLTIPSAFCLTGWCSFPLIILATIVMLFTSHLFGKVISEIESRGIFDVDFGVIVKLTFGDKAQPLFVAICMGECLFLTVFFLVFAGNAIGPTFDVEVASVISVAALVSVLLLLVPKHVLSILSYIMIVLTLTTIAITIASGYMLEAKATDQTWLGQKGVAGFGSTMAFVALSTGSHCIYPNIYRTVGNDSNFQAGVQGGFYFFMVVALILGSATYACFGTSLNPVVLTNIGRDINGKTIDGAWSLLAKYSNMVIAVRALVLLPNFLKPLATLLHTGVAKVFGLDLSVPADLQSEFYVWADSKQKFVVRMAVFCVTICGCALFGIFLSEKLAQLETLTAAFFKSINCFLVPCCSFWVLCGTQMNTLQKAALLLTLIGGVTWGVVSTSSSIVGIIAR